MNQVVVEETHKEQAKPVPVNTTINTTGATVAPSGNQSQGYDGKSYDALIAEAKNFETANKKAEAIKIYEELVKRNPTKTDLYKNLGVWNRSLSKNDEAIVWDTKLFEIDPKSVDACNGLGNSHRNKKNYEEAIKWYKKGLENNPKSNFSYNGLGNVYGDLKKPQEAKENYLHAIQCNPQMEAPHSSIGSILFDQKNYQQSFKYYEKASVINSKNHCTFYSLALNRKNQNKLEEAIPFVKKAIQINPKYENAYNLLANIYQAQKNYIESEKQYKKAIQINPKFNFPYNGLGNSLFGRKLYKESIVAYQKAIDVDPKYATPYSGMADSLKELGELDKAMEIYKKCIELDPKNQNPFNGIGNVYKAKGKIEESIVWIDKSIAINPKNSCAYNGKGNALKDLKKFDEAVQCYLKAIQLNPSYNYAWNGLGNAYQGLKKWDEAEKAYKKCMEVDPLYDKSFNNLGNQYSTLGKYDDAIKMYQKSLVLNPKNDATYNGLGNLYNKQKKYEKAIESFKKAIQNNKNYALAYINLSMNYITQQNYQEAFKNLKQAKNIVETAEIDVFCGCKDFITGKLNDFDKQIEEWDYKIKNGYLTANDKARIQKMREDFENKFKNIFSIGQDGTEKMDTSQINHHFLKILSKVMKDQFTMADDAEIAKLNYELFKEDSDNFSLLAYLFCKFFWTQKNTTKLSIKEIETALDKKLDKLSALFPPSTSTVTENTKITLKASITPKDINLFKSIEYFKDYQYLVKEIEGIHEIAKKVLPKFKDFIYKICSDFGGFHTKANLKLPENETERFKVYIRIMEKMFKEVGQQKNDIIDKVEAKLKGQNNSSMQAVISHLVTVWTDAINKILAERTKNHTPTSCNISDFVRGKTMFHKISELEGAANKIIESCAGNGFEITEIDNRLGKETKDLVFKILIDGMTCEFQMALESDTTQYDFAHSLYEIKRSPMGCIFGSYLFLSKYKALSFLKQAKELEKYYSGKTLQSDELNHFESVKYIMEAFNKDK